MNPSASAALHTGRTVFLRRPRGDAISTCAYEGGGVDAGRPAVLGVILLAGILSGCATPQGAPSAPARAAARAQAPASAQAVAPTQAPARGIAGPPRSGRSFEVVSAESRLTVLVYRAGVLAALGHNHVVSCRCLTGTVYLPRDPLRAGFDLRIEADAFTVDDPVLRAAEHSRDFPPDGEPSARQGTRDHMLGAALLNAAKYPDITLRSEGLRASPGGRRGDVVAEVLVGMAGHERPVTVPIHYDIRADEIVIAGEFPLKQTDLGLTPFSLAGGALKVRDAMTVRLRLLARPSHRP